MQIEKCILSDVDNIYHLYEHARNTQRERNVVVWPHFDKEVLSQEVEESRQWKIVSHDKMICNWVITYNDPEIWGDKDNNNSIFIHRLCIDRAMRGHRLLDEVVSWARKFAAAQGKQYVRLDTLGNNTGLIKHYTSAGFDFLGISILEDTANLPAHYQDEPQCCLFEIDLKK
jgi:ribosomal protein S18 acetylase RimI-like enzyme